MPYLPSTLLDSSPAPPARPIPGAWDIFDRINIETLNLTDAGESQRLPLATSSFSVFTVLQC